MLLVQHKHSTVGDMLGKVKNNQTYQNVKISCVNGMLKENTLIVGLVFYKILKDFDFAILPDSVIILPDFSLEEVRNTFSKAYSQPYNKKLIEEGAVHSELKYSEDSVDYEELNNPIDEYKDEQEVGDSLKEEPGLETNGDELKYLCSSCDYTSKQKGNLKSHVERNHMERITYTCDICTYSFKNHAKFLKHKKNPCTAKNEKCLFCDKKSMSKEAARAHRRRIHQEEWKQYKEEKKCLDESDQGEKAIKSAIPISDKSKAKLEYNKALERVKVPCEICAQLVAKDHLRKHLVHVHKQGFIKKAKNIYPKISCPECGKKVSSVTVRKHLRVAHNLRGGLGTMEVECIYCLLQIPLTKYEYHVRNTCFARNLKTSNDQDAE